MIAAAYWWGWVLAHPVTLLVWGALAVLCVVGVTAYYHATSEDDPEAPRRGTRSRARGAPPRRHALLGSACRRGGAWVTSWFWWLDSDAGWHPRQAALERAPWARQAITRRIQRLKEVMPHDGVAAADDQPIHPKRVSPGDPPAGIPKNAGHGGSPDQAANMKSGLRLPGQPETPALAPGCARDDGEGEGRAFHGLNHAHTEPTRLATAAERDAAASPWEHDTSWFTLPAIDADVAAKDGA